MSALSDLFGSAAPASSLLNLTPTKPLPTPSTKVAPTNPAIAAPKVFSKEDYPERKRKSEKEKKEKGEKYVDEDNGGVRVKGGKKRMRDAANKAEAGSKVDGKDARDAAEAAAAEEEDPATATTTGESKAATSSKANDDERTLFVSNLPPTTTSAQLKKIFKAHGAVSSARIRATPQSETGYKLPPGQEGNAALQKKVNAIKVDKKEKVVSVVGYVVFEQASSVEAAVAQEEPTVYESRTLVLDRVGKFAAKNDAANSVFVGNLPFLADEETLKTFINKGLGEDTEVVRVRIVRDKDTRKCIGIGYLLMADRQGVAAVLDKGGEGFGTYMKKVLRLEVCGSRTKNRKGDKNPNAKVPGYMGRVVTGSGRRVLGNLKKKGVLKPNVKHPPKKPKSRPATAAPTKQGGAKVSKRAANEKKTNDRVRKIEKRIQKGMGAQKKSKKE
jgi:RNA recognition motif-containing protein